MLRFRSGELGKSKTYEKLGHGGIGNRNIRRRVTWGGGGETESRKIK